MKLGDSHRKENGKPISIRAHLKRGYHGLTLQVNRRPDPERPKSVPAEAEWFEGNKRWAAAFGRAQAGKLSGMIRFWTRGGKLECEWACVRNLYHGKTTRWHPNGELACEAWFVHQKPLSVRFYRSSQSSPEPKLPAWCIRRRIWSVAEICSKPGLIDVCRCYDKAGQEVDSAGKRIPKKRPHGVPPTAKYENTSQTWIDGRTRQFNGGRRIGAWRWWNPKGKLLLTDVYSNRGKLLRQHGPDKDTELNRYPYGATSIRAFWRPGD